jgi:hypothetical protein
MSREIPCAGQTVWIDVQREDGRPTMAVVERVTAPWSDGAVVTVRLESGRTAALLLSSRGELWDVVGDRPDDS